MNDFFVCVNGWIKVLYVWMDMNKGFCEWMSEFFVCVNGWMKVNLYVWWMNEGFECVNGWKKVVNAWMDEWKLICMCEWMNEG